MPNIYKSSVCPRGSTAFRTTKLNERGVQITQVTFECSRNLELDPLIQREEGLRGTSFLNSRSMKRHKRVDLTTENSCRLNGKRQRETNKRRVLEC